MSAEKLKTRLGYFIACIGEFAREKKVSSDAAFAYLDRYHGMDFLVKCYEAEHTLSFADAVSDLSAVCRRHGGHL